ncbi:MAG TPA: PQQ-binding-like beta-propeller repeat protein [Terriglobia bacterium]|nr:PQQ-binding-like beta-propeller repeat protein [Terriglobia bacterium]
MRCTILVLSCLVLTFRPQEASSQNPAAADWPAYARDYGSTGYSPLSEIKPENVSSLKQICSYSLPEQSTFESSLLVLNGTMYFATSEYTYAVDASNCALRWRVRHQMQNPGRTVRGVAIAGNRLYRGFSDGNVMAYDLGSGDQLWTTRLTETDGRPATIAASPVAWNGMVFIGTSGAERACGCILAGLDANSGRVMWTFPLVPTGNAPGAETWPKGVRVGGGSVWTALSIDTNSGTLYTSTGNPGPDFFGDYRPGANLYTGSIVALEARTGALRSWYQLVPHDVHDWDQAAAPALVTTRRGRRRAMAAGKDGYLHAIDIDNKAVAWKTPVTSIVNVDAPLTPEGTFFCPGTAGGVLWNGPAFSPETNLVFVNSIDWCTTLKLDTKAPVFEPEKQFLGSANAFGEKDERRKGWITAVDADTGVVRWRHETPAPMVAGIAVTATGLVFTAGLDGDLLAFDAASGKVLHRLPTQQPAGGGVITYETGGKQRIAVATGLQDTILQTNGKPVIIVYGL